MSLTLNTHFNLLLSCMYLPLAAIVSEISTVFLFSYRKALVTKFDLDVKRSRSLKGHYLYKL